MLHISQLTKTYRTKSGVVTALSDINLNVKKGEFLAIIGASGSGKSTLMNMLGCLDKPDFGTYTLSGEDVFSLGQKKLSALRNREIGFIFQGFNLLEKLSALENVELPLAFAGVPTTSRRDIAKAALSRVGLSERLRHKPSELSGGQQQRVAIARAITQKPSLILADEPTGNLDFKSGTQILEILSELHASGATIILITHDRNVAKKADRIVEISDGKIKTT